MRTKLEHKEGVTLFAGSQFTHVIGRDFIRVNNACDASCDNRHWLCAGSGYQHSNYDKDGRQNAAYLILSGLNHRRPLSLFLRPRSLPNHRDTQTSRPTYCG